MAKFWQNLLQTLVLCVQLLWNTTRKRFDVHTTVWHCRQNSCCSCHLVRGTHEGHPYMVNICFWRQHCYVQGCGTRADIFWTDLVLSISKSIIKLIFTSLQWSCMWNAWSRIQFHINHITYCALVKSLFQPNKIVCFRIVVPKRGIWLVSTANQEKIGNNWKSLGCL